MKTILMRLCLVMWLCVVTCSQLVPRVSVDVANDSPGVLKHFWRSTGLCPPAPHSEAHKSLLSKDYLMNLMLISALPGQAISHVRIHWLLELVSLRFEEGVARYNWTHLDSLLDWMYHYHLLPGFELMGNPSAVFTDFENDTQVNQWKLLVSELGRRYIERYGAENVSLWRFETWNEPDLKGYNTIPFTLSGYLRYWNASVEGLKNIPGSHLRLGGPAGLFKRREKHPLCWGFLKYCAQTSCQIGYLSFHKKGNSSGLSILRDTVQLLRKIYKMYPGLQGIPVANDEADPLTGWSRSESWRADMRYGAMAAFVIAKHHQMMIRKLGLSIEVLSNDNGFLNYHPYYFSQRTLLARFQMNNTNPPHIQFFRKPVYMTMGLLSLLGDTELHTSTKHWDHRRLAVLAASSVDRDGSWSAGILLTFSADTEEQRETFSNVTVVIKNAPVRKDGDVFYTAWILDNVHSNPNQVWLKAGAPVFPEPVLRQQMRSAEGPLRLLPLSPMPAIGRLQVQLVLPLPSVALLHVCQRPDEPPGQVTQLEVFNITFNEVLLKWDDSFVTSRCIKTYEVEFSPTHLEVSSVFQRVNLDDIIFLSFQYVILKETAMGGEWQEQVRGLYRVRAVDFWSRPGAYSSNVPYP